MYVTSEYKNKTVRIITKTPKWEHITEQFKNLPRLKIKDYIAYRLLCIAYKCINEDMPIYLTELLNIYYPARNLRSNCQNYFNLIVHN